MIFMAAIIIDDILKTITNDRKSFLSFHIGSKRFCIVRKLTKIN